MIALIRKGSGAVVGVVTVNGSTGPLGVAALRENLDLHRVPMVEFETGRAMKWTTAWLLSDARALPKPVPHQHPFGAVTWVNLDPAVEAMVRAQLHDIDFESVDLIEVEIDSARDKMTLRPRFSIDPACLVPIASDGSWFGPHLLKAGQFTIGAKGEEKRVDLYEEALIALACMEVARWRRPNAKGNWGIVSGVRWIHASDLMTAVPDPTATPRIRARPHLALRK